MGDVISEVIYHLQHHTGTVSSHLLAPSFLLVWLLYLSSAINHSQVHGKSEVRSLSNTAAVHYCSSHVYIYIPSVIQFYFSLFLCECVCVFVDECVFLQKGFTRFGQEC